MKQQVLAAAVIILVASAGFAVKAREPAGTANGDRSDCTFDKAAGAEVNADPRPLLILSARPSSLWVRRESGYNMYLRFYSDGTVIGVSSTGTPTQIERWFKAPYADTGRYLLNGLRARFSLTSSAGRVDYDGMIEGSKLELLSCSRINGKRSTDVYERAADR